MSVALATGDHAGVSRALYQWSIRRLDNQLMPHKKVQLERKDIALAFAILTFAFVIMGVFLVQTIQDTNDALHQTRALAIQNKRNVKVIQRSRIESCQRTYNIFQDIISLSVSDRKREQGGTLSKKQRAALAKYLARLSPKQCYKLVVPPTALPKRSN